jgi:hypothetical protein
MANKLYYLAPVGVGADLGGSGVQNSYNYTGTSGDQGHGWSAQLSLTNTQFTANNPVFALPSNARNLSVTYSYNGAATVTFAPTGSNDTLASVVGGSAVFGTLPPTMAPSILGGTAGSTAVCAAVNSPPEFLGFVIGGTGAAGADTITITISANTIIRP